MGDYWKHEVRVEAILDADPKKPYPVCTGGAGACPPEECGGPEGYLARRDDPRRCNWPHARHQRLMGAFAGRCGPKMSHNPA
jgi:hypothetical protein